MTCATCTAEATVHRGPFHFCEECSEASAKRTENARKVLRRHGLENTEFGRAIGAHRG